MNQYWTVFKIKSLLKLRSLKPKNKKYVLRDDSYDIFTVQICQK